MVEKKGSAHLWAYLCSDNRRKVIAERDRRMLELSAGLCLLHELELEIVFGVRG
jgi:hypothetical protein